MLLLDQRDSLNSRPYRANGMVVQKEAAAAIVRDLSKWFGGWRRRRESQSAGREGYADTKTWPTTRASAYH